MFLLWFLLELLAAVHILTFHPSRTLGDKTSKIQFLALRSWPSNQIASVSCVSKSSGRCRLHFSRMGLDAKVMMSQPWHQPLRFLFLSSRQTHESYQLYHSTQGSLPCSTDVWTYRRWEPSVIKTRSLSSFFLTKLEHMFSRLKKKKSTVSGLIWNILAKRSAPGFRRW